MSNIKRDYRTTASMKAVVFIDHKEITCIISDLSISGAKLEIKPLPYFDSVIMLSELVDVGDDIDFSAQELHFDGKVKVIRKEILNERLYLSITLDDIFYGLANLPYKREVYRTDHRISGLIIINGQRYEAISQNVSVTGMSIAIFQSANITNGDELTLNFHNLGINGKAKIVWREKTDDKTLLGVKYVQLMDPADGIASFSKN